MLIFKLLQAKQPINTRNISKKIILAGIKSSFFTKVLTKGNIELNNNTDKK